MLNNSITVWLRRKLFRSVLFLLFHTQAIRFLNFLLNEVEALSRNSFHERTTTEEKRKVYSSIRQVLERGFLILYYHRINEENDPYFPATSTSIFEEQIKYLAKNYRILPLDEIIAQAKEGSMPQNAIAITFDDGYKDNLINAYPILKKYSAPATIFLTTGYIDSGQIPLWDKLSYIFKKTPKYSLNVNIQRPKTYALYTIKERIWAMYNTLMDIHKCGSEEEKRYWVEWLGKALEIKDLSGIANQMLTWDEVGFMKGSGIYFGAHTITHPDLTKVTLDEAIREISGSKRGLEEKLGMVINSFAYPRGDFNDKVKDVVREVGFSYACATVMGVNGSNLDLFALRRISSLEVPLYVFSFLLEWVRYFPHQKKYNY